MDDIKGLQLLLIWVRNLVHCHVPIDYLLSAFWKKKCFAPNSVTDWRNWPSLSPTLVSGNLPRQLSAEEPILHTLKPCAFRSAEVQLGQNRGVLLLYMFRNVKESSDVEASCWYLFTVGCKQFILILANGPSNPPLSPVLLVLCSFLHIWIWA